MDLMPAPWVLHGGDEGGAQDPASHAVNQMARAEIIRGDTHTNLSALVNGEHDGSDRERLGRGRAKLMEAGQVGTTTGRKRPQKSPADGSDFHGRSSAMRGIEDDGVQGTGWEHGPILQRLRF